MILPEVTTPKALAQRLGWAEKRVRSLAKRLGACRVLGNRMVFLPQDVAKMEAYAADDNAPEPPKLTVDESKHQVYFIRNDKFVKIGWSSNWRARLITLQAATPIRLEVLAVYRGGVTFERELHTLFASKRVSGEWFRDCRDIRKFIEVNKDGCLLP